MAQIPVPDDLLPDHPASESVPDVIRNRRTSLVVDPARPVDPEVVRGLIELATWAPNHKRTWPWRFTVLTGESRSHLGEAFAAVGESLDMDPMKVSSQRTKYLRSPVVVLVSIILI